MTDSETRRDFFAWTRNSLAAAGIVTAVPASAEAAVAGTDYYDKLGVTKIINAAGTYTALTASIMPPQVQAAVAAAAKHPVRLAELQQKSGEYIAKKLKCEAALVTAGASSALTLGTAACMTVGKRETVKLLPLEVSNLKNEVIVQKAHRSLPAVLFVDDFKNDDVDALLQGHPAFVCIEHERTRFVEHINIHTVKVDSPLIITGHRHDHIGRGYMAEYPRATTRGLWHQRHEAVRRRGAVSHRHRNAVLCVRLLASGR